MYLFIYKNMHNAYYFGNKISKNKAKIILSYRRVLNHYKVFKENRTIKTDGLISVNLGRFDLLHRIVDDLYSIKAEEKILINSVKGSSDKIPYDKHHIRKCNYCIVHSYNDYTDNVIHHYNFIDNINNKSISIITDDDYYRITELNPLDHGEIIIPSKLTIHNFDAYTRNNIMKDRFVITNAVDNLIKFILQTYYIK